MVETSSEEEDVSTGDTGVSTARAGRASRAGARAGRVFRVVRLVRLVRVIKVYKYYKDIRAKKEEAARLEEEIQLALEAGDDERAYQLRKEQINPDNSDEPKSVKESRVGAALSDLTTRRVIVGILLMLVCIPLLTPTVLDESDNFALQLVQRMAVERAQVVPADQAGYNAAYDLSIAQFKESRTNAVLLTVDGTSVIDEDRSDLRDVEILKLVVKTTLVTDNPASSDNGRVFESSAWFDEKFVSQETAMWSLVLTAFVILVLAVSAMMFSHDANVLVLVPISHLVTVVQKISNNPLDPDAVKPDDLSAFKEGMETTLLLRTITKIGGLLRVGFGEAGATIIAGNLNEAAELDPCKPGKKMYAIYGFCDIRKFTDTTECLQEYVMLFVNMMAELVHGTVAQHKGAANKNIGDAFLLVWKFDDRTPNLYEELCDQSWRARQTKRTKPPAHVQLADQALMALLKVIAETERTDVIGNLDIKSSRKRYQITKKLNSRMPNYRVRMGFGLHWGWAIEGAIGSDKKIDASYIGASVKMSEMLEGGTKTYGVPLLLTGEFHSILSTRAQYYCRQVDHLRVPAEKNPIDLFTFDCNMEAPFGLIPATDPSSKHKRKKRRPRHTHTHHAAAVTALTHGTAEAKEEPAAPAVAPIVDVEAGHAHVPRKKKRWEVPFDYSESEWDTNWDLRRMQKGYSTPELRALFERGLGLFLGTVEPVGHRTIMLKPKHKLGVKSGASLPIQTQKVTVPNWQKARQVLTQVSDLQRRMIEAELEHLRTKMPEAYYKDTRRRWLDSYKGDGPSLFLLSVMQAEMNTPPETWDCTHFVDLH